MRCQRIEFDFTDNGIRQLMFESYLGFRIEMELHVVSTVHDVGNVQTVDRRVSPACSPGPNEGWRGSRSTADTTLWVVVVAESSCNQSASPRALMVAVGVLMARCAYDEVPGDSVANQSVEQGNVDLAVECQPPSSRPLTCPAESAKREYLRQATFHLFLSKTASSRHTPLSRGVRFGLQTLSKILLPDYRRDVVQPGRQDADDV